MSFDFKQVSNGCYNCAHRVVLWCSIHEIKITYPGTCSDHYVDTKVQTSITGNIKRILSKAK